ncbi:GDSL-type esterase/lipase family protein [Erysipelothrix urinaevulpis]|uniref:GDSL-type esterase/lipase family protein n=1 Tax=Erysipelothrix urinaevulpis TaxID=2683717 RepID=UPI0013572CD2|nr:GDSL-type esterase/lipase family protein [Erysipelothrix urinaevulpis]
MQENMKYNMDTYQFRKDVLEKILKIIDKQSTTPKGGTLFFGDSLVELMPSNVPVINNGIGGMSSKALEGLLDELVIKFEPAKVYLHIGTNDLGQTVMDSPRDIAQNVQRLFYILKRNLPDAELNLISTLPNIDELDSMQSTNRGMRTRDLIELLNKEYQYHLELLDVNFINLYPALFNEEGQLMTELYQDGLHVNEKGYKCLMDYYKKHY